MLERSVIHWQLSILEDEALHDMAVVDVDAEDFGEADEHIVLHAVLRVDERRQLLRKVDCLIHCNLSGLFFVFLEQEGEGVDDLVPGGPVRVQPGAVLKHGIVLAQLGQEVVQRFHGPGPKHLVQNVDLGQQLPRDLLKAPWQLGHISEGNLEIVAKVGEAIALQPRNDRLNDHWVLAGVDLINDLILALQVDRGAHKNQRRVQRIFIASLL